MKYIEQWLCGLGLEYIVPKLKENGITTPKKLAQLSLRDMYEVGVEDADDRKKLYYLIQRLQSILNKDQKKTKTEEDNSTTSSDKMEKSQEPPPPPPLPQNVNRNAHMEHPAPAHNHNARRKHQSSNSPVQATSPSPPSPSGLLVKEDINNYDRAPSPIRTQQELRRNTTAHKMNNNIDGRDMRRSDDNIVVTSNKDALITPTRIHASGKHTTNDSNPHIKPVLQFKQQKLQPPMASKYGHASPEDSHNKYQYEQTTPNAIHVSPTNERYDYEVQSEDDLEEVLDEEYVSSDGQESDVDIADMAIRVVVRKRPLSKKEASKGETDIAEMLSHGRVLIHDLKTKVDLTRYVETIDFKFDDCFGEKDTNETIYNRTVKHLVGGVFEGGKATCFAYGQTGSGKTFTMMGVPNSRTNIGLYALAARDVFNAINLPENRNRLSVKVSCFEIYGGKLLDLLNDRKLIKCLEDGQQQVQLVGMTEHAIVNTNELIEVMSRANTLRSTGSTTANAESSRSHQILQLSIKETKEVVVNSGGKYHKGSKFSNRKQMVEVEYGKLSFIDLAGSEKASDSGNSSKQTRMEGAEINTSLLALKEVIRSLDRKKGGKGHTPFRGSKLTQVLKDSFVGTNTHTCMVACISPSSAFTEHTLNTLRYADRVKEHCCSGNPNEISPPPPVNPNANRNHNPASRPQTASSALDNESLGRNGGDKKLSNLMNKMQISPTVSTKKTVSNSNKMSPTRSKDRSSMVPAVSGRPSTAPGRENERKKPSTSGLNRAKINLSDHLCIEKSSDLNVAPSKEISSDHNHGPNYKHAKSNPPIKQQDVLVSQVVSSDDDTVEDAMDTESDEEQSNHMHSNNRIERKSNDSQHAVNLLYAHKLAIAEMVEVMKDEMELVQDMEQADDRDPEEYVDSLTTILRNKSNAILNLKAELEKFKKFRQLHN